MIQVLIIEDEALAAERLANLVRRYDDSISLMGPAASVQAGVEILQGDQKPDLILADIHLSDGRSFDIFTQVPIDCPVIFVTSYDEYALEAFSVMSIDYLLKPIRFEKLAAALDRFKSLTGEETAAVDEAEGPSALDIDGLLQQLSRDPRKQYRSRFLVRQGNRLLIVPVADIAYFYSEQKVSLLVTRAGRRYAVDFSLENLADMLDPHQFFRVNRQFIVQVDSVKVMHPYFKGRLKIELEPPTTEDVVVSSDKTPVFKAWLDQ